LGDDGSFRFPVPHDVLLLLVWFGRRRLVPTRSFNQSRPFLFCFMPSQCYYYKWVSVLGGDGVVWLPFSHDMVLHSVRIGRRRPVPVPLFPPPARFRVCSVPQPVFVTTKGEIIGMMADCLGTILLTTWCCLRSRSAVNNPVPVPFYPLALVSGSAPCPASVCFQER
jgi:hypothetical protein